MPNKDKLITLAIHTYDRAISLKNLLEKNGIEVSISNVNLNKPEISSGVRVRIYEEDLPLALKITEQISLTPSSHKESSKRTTKKETPHILIPIDFSEYSYKACVIGFDFANRLGAKVVILYSSASLSYSGGLPFYNDGYTSEIINIEDENELNKISHSKMHSFCSKIKSEIASGELPHADFKSVITQGIPEDAILEEAKQMHANLIVMGTRGKDKKEAQLIGSVTAEVLDAGKFPVFTVPEEINIKSLSNIKKVIFFSNMSQQDLISFDTFVRLFSNHTLNVTIVPIFEKKAEKVEERNSALLEYSAEHYPQFEFSIETFQEDNFITELDKYIQEKGINLIIIPNKKRNIFARLFSPSVAHKMLFHSDTPMLVIPV